MSCILSFNNPRQQIIACNYFASWNHPSNALDTETWRLCSGNWYKNFNSSRNWKNNIPIQQ